MTPRTVRHDRILSVHHILRVTAERKKRVPAMERDNLGVRVNEPVASRCRLSERSLVNRLQDRGVVVAKQDPRAPRAPRS